MKRFVAAVFAILLGACTQIDTGNVGVEATLGQVKPQTMDPGMYFTAFKTVYEVCAREMPLSLNDMRPQTSDKITLTDLDVDFYIQIDPSKAPTILTKWAGDRIAVKDEGCDRVGMNYVTRQAREALYDVASKFKSDTIHTERVNIAAGAVKALQASLDAEAGKGMFFVRSANVRNLVTDPALEKNIKDAANAQFQLQAERNLLEVTRVQADRQRAQAQGEADAIRIKAEAVAKQGGAEYVQLQAIQKWNGVLPATNAGGAMPFLHLK